MLNIGSYIKPFDEIEKIKINIFYELKIGKFLAVSISLSCPWPCLFPSGRYEGDIYIYYLCVWVVRSPVSQSVSQSMS